VSEVFSQMGGKKLTTTISVIRTKKIVRRFLLSIIYPIVNWRFVRKQTELLTAESQDRFVRSRVRTKNFRSASEVLMVESVCFELVLEQLVGLDGSNACLLGRLFGRVNRYKRPPKLSAVAETTFYKSAKPCVSCLQINCNYFLCLCMVFALL
jgi:hypothetical protein